MNQNDAGATTMVKPSWFPGFIGFAGFAREGYSRTWILLAKVGVLDAQQLRGLGLQSIGTMKRSAYKLRLGRESLLQRPRLPFPLLQLLNCR